MNWLLIKLVQDWTHHCKYELDLSLLLVHKANNMHFKFYYVIIRQVQILMLQVIDIKLLTDINKKQIKKVLILYIE